MDAKIVVTKAGHDCGQPERKRDADRKRNTVESPATQGNIPKFETPSRTTRPARPPWQVAKFEARIQAASTSNSPVVLRVDEHPGHGIGDSADVHYAELADVFALILHEDGVQPRVPGARTP